MKRLKTIMFACIMTIILLPLSGCGKTTINLNKYIVFESSGYNSVGYVNAYFDINSFSKDYAGKIKIASGYEDAVEEAKYTSGETIEEIIYYEFIDWTFDKTNGLSNGDKVTMFWNCDTATAEQYFDVRLKYSDMEYKVEGLEDLGTFDPFEYINVSFSGTAPHCHVTVTPDSSRDEMTYINFYADKTAELNIGDTVLITANISGDDESFARKFGVVLSETKKEYKCENADHYAAEVDEIPEDMMENMKSQGEDTFRADVANSWDDPTKLISVDYFGNYFLKLKPAMSDSTENYLYLIYEIQTVVPETDDILTYYYYIRFSNIIILSDGTCSVDLSNYHVPQFGWLSSESFNVNNWIYLGYEDIDTLFNKCIVTKIDKYEYTTTVKS